LRGDLAKVSIGKLTHVGANTVLRPCHKVLKGTNFTYFPVLVGAYVVIGEDCVIAAATIGAYVKIGNNVIIVTFFVCLLLKLIAIIILILNMV
jgi:carbonic anhydrase/acetyltransferase-like protein (isoleucine patch superfamily)